MKLYKAGLKCGVWMEGDMVSSPIKGAIAGHGISYPDHNGGEPELRYHVKLDIPLDDGFLNITHILVHPDNLRVYVICHD